MTNFRKWISVSATAMTVVAFHCAFAQNDLDDLLKELKTFLQKVYVVNPSAEFNQHPVTAIGGVPFDLQALVAKGR